MQTPNTGMTAYERGYIQGRAGIAITIAVSQASAYVRDADGDEYMIGWCDGAGDSEREPVKKVLTTSAQRRRERRRHLRPAVKEELEQWDF